MVNDPKIGNTYKLFIPGSCIKLLNKRVGATKSVRRVQRFHEKIVEVVKIIAGNTRYDPPWNKPSRLALVKGYFDGGRGLDLWVDVDWLFTIDPQGFCICDLTILMTQGCKCGGK